MGKFHADSLQRTPPHPMWLENRAGYLPYPTGYAGSQGQGAALNGFWFIKKGLIHLGLPYSATILA